MAKRLHQYVKYTVEELHSYTQIEGSCVRKVNKNLHLSLGPYSLADFKHAILTYIVREKVGFYDVQLNGIVLDIKNIKMLGTSGALRNDDPRIHVNINADCYVFRPVAGAVLKGTVKHIGNRQVGTIIYRVFNANIRFTHKLNKDHVQIDQEIHFRIKDFNLQSVFPYIEGELLAEPSIVRKRLKSEGRESTQDSGIEEKEVFDLDDLDQLVSLIKKEEDTVTEQLSIKKKKHKVSKIERLNDSAEKLPTANVKTEPREVSRKRKSRTRSLSRAFDTEPKSQP